MIILQSKTVENCFISMGFIRDAIFVNTRLLLESINKLIDFNVKILTAEIISHFGQIISC